MDWFLPRGIQITPNERIKKLIAADNDWQIFLTNIDSYALAVKQDLYKMWVQNYSLPEGLFKNDVVSQYWVLISTDNYIISSMEHGPYPEDNKQIEAFSIAFKTAHDLYTDADLNKAIYIEEYSLLLPTSFNEERADAGVVYGKWLTGGIGIPIYSIDRISKIMSWLPKDALIKLANMAGFDIPKDNVLSKEDADKKQTANLTNQDKEINQIGTIPSTPFKLIGRPDLEQFFNDNIIDIVLHQDQYKRMGIPFPGATILHGLPGCGKTYAVDRLADYLGWPRFDIDSSTIASPYIHDTSKKISEVFQSAISAAPSILVIDEMEAFLSDRNMSGSTGGHHIEEVAEFLRRIPEAITNNVLIIAMTNMIDAIDPAILRRGRFDHIVEVKMPTAEEIESLLSARFAELPVDESVNAKAIAQDLAEHPMSDVSFVLREAGRFAVKRKMDYISGECFADAIELLPKKQESRKIGF